MSRYLRTFIAKRLLWLMKPLGRLSGKLAIWAFMLAPEVFEYDGKNR